MSSNKTIAKNTLFLYLRMLITTVVSLFTSRIVIDALGFADYGLYSLVGGITGMIAFMHTSLAGATIRFMNIEIGKANIENLKSVFNSALIIHFSLALLVFIIAETFGLWFLYQKLNVEPGRFNAAFWVYQFSVISVLMGVIQIPYDAAIIAHQKMSIYAYISILESVLKLFIAYAVYISPFDKLIVYSALVLLVSIIIRTIYQIYCVRNFKECSFKWKINKDYIKSISSFFGWDLFGNFSVIAKYQGVQIIQNIFFGTIINASHGIATTVSGVVSGFAGNFSIASKPQIVQLYAENKIEEMIKLLFLTSRITFFLMFLFSMPFIVESEFFLNLWLITIPPYAVVFCKLIFIQILVNSFFSQLNQPIHATGKIKALSLIGGIIIFLNLPITYLLLKNGGQPEVAYIIAILLSIVGGCVNLLIINKLIPRFSITDYFGMLMINIVVVIVGTIPGLLIHSIVETSFLNSIYSILLLLVGSCMSIYCVGFQNEERKFIITKLKVIIKRR